MLPRLKYCRFLACSVYTLGVQASTCVLVSPTLDSTEPSATVYGAPWHAVVLDRCKPLQPAGPDSSQLATCSACLLT
jgi:hypothetical protein